MSEILGILAAGGVVIIMYCASCLKRTHHIKTTKANGEIWAECQNPECMKKSLLYPEPKEKIQ